MKKIYTLLVTIFILTGHAGAQNEIPNREFRGAWVTTVYGLDWPENVGLSQEEQKSRLRTLLDDLKDAGLNAVLFQVRTECDALYNSNYEPWSRWLTGTQGQGPGYDPLTFAIEETHKRGMELHAWMNPYRVNASAGTFSNDHVSNTHPEWILEFSTGDKILNPGLPEVREYIADVVTDVVVNYDVDGVHFDDYFYPYPDDGFSGITNEDETTYITYGGSFDNIEDWRRDNINKTIEGVNSAIKGEKAYVRFGVSPFGIWKNGVPAGVTGLSAYDVIYADAPHWLENGTIDYLTPQLYWVIGGNQDFSKLLPWWSEKAFNAGKHLYSGHTLDKITSSSTNGRSIAQYERAARQGKKSSSNARTLQTAQEVPNQIEIVRDNQDKNALGSVFFRAEFVSDNPHGFTDYLKANTYTRPAAPPAMTWLPEMKPLAPENLTYQINEATGDAELQWNRSSGNTYDFKRYVIYQLANASGTINPTNAVQDIVVTEDNTVPYADIPVGISHWGVVELGLTNTTSDISNIVTIEKIVPLPNVPSITLPTMVESSSNETFIRIEWASQPAIVYYHYQLAANSDFTTILEENAELEGSATARLFSNIESGTYYFRLRASNEEGWSEWTATYKIERGTEVTGLSSHDYLNYLSLYPNPSAGRQFVNLNVSLSRHADLSIEITSLMGKQNIALASKEYRAGDHSIKINCETLPKGLYLLQLKSKEFQHTKRLIIN